MGIKWHTKTNKIPKMINSMGELNGEKVQVGVLNGNNAWLAGIHEYGCNITVTPKMRAYLHRMGLHLKDSTTVIRIPERSFLRNGHDENAERVIKQTERAIGQVIMGEMTIDDLIDLYGQQMSTAIKNYMRNLSRPDNHPFTVSQKGSSNPLIDTGGLLESITWKRE